MRIARKLFSVAPFLSLPLALRAEWLYRVLPVLPEQTNLETRCPLPMLSIIIPARNEAHNLRRLLPSLTAVHYPGPLEVIVVDDNSTDETAVVAETAGACVLRLRHLPAGWLGKPHACHKGAKIARGEWLLFTDADTVHAPHGPRSAVAYAVAEDCDGLSLFLAHETKSWWEHVTLLVAYPALFAGLRRLDSLLNGQYILLRRDVYRASRGFAAVRQQPLEDLALGHRLRSLGYRVPLLRGERAAQVRMYSHFSHLWQGMTRLGAGSLRWSGMGALFTALFTGMLVTPLLSLAAALVRGRLRLWSVVGWLVSAAGMIPWARRLGSWWWALLAPVGAALVQVTAVWGLLNRFFGRSVQWKDRPV